MIRFFKNLVAASLILLVSSCSNKSATTLSPTDFSTKINETVGAIVLDVRTEAELASGVIQNAINIVYDQDFESRLASLPNKPIFIYCASGKRSARAAQILRDKGYSPVYELENGLNHWIEAGLPTVAPGNPSIPQ